MKMGRSSNLFSQSRRLLESNQIKSKVLFKVGTFTNSTNISSHELLKALIFSSLVFGKDGKGISFKNRLKGHINWRKVRNVSII
jgi:hypothetical protein